MSSPESFQSLRVVLVASRNPLNIGAAARAMSNFGFSQLRLVTPYAPALEGAASAVGAVELLKQAEVFDSVAEAVRDCPLVIGTTAAGRRQLEQPLHSLPEASPRILAAMAEAPVALLFGSEKRGLSNEELSYCDALLRIPVRDEHSSMNLGQSVAICLYELARGFGGELSTLSLGEKSRERAETADVERLESLLAESLLECGYWQQENVLEREKLRRLLRRLQMGKEDAPVLLGMLRQMRWKMRQGGEKASK
jgi:tRNA/rRNA methyltransferase